MSELRLILFILINLHHFIWFVNGSDGLSILEYMVIKGFNTQNLSLADLVSMYLLFRKNIFELGVEVYSCTYDIHFLFITCLDNIKQLHFALWTLRLLLQHVIQSFRQFDVFEGTWSRLLQKQGQLFVIWSYRLFTPSKVLRCHYIIKKGNSDTRLQ